MILTDIDGVKVTIYLGDILESITAMTKMVKVAKEKKDEEAVRIFDTAKDVMTGFMMEHFTAEEIEKVLEDLENDRRGVF